MSPSLLSNRLKSLEAADILTRTQTGNGVRYALTAAGQELKPILVQMGVWGQRWARSQLDPDDLDPSLLMWDIHRTMNADYFGAGRTVLLFEFSDYTSHFRRWWLVVEGGEVDVCMRDPGHEVDVHLLTNTKTLTGVWMGDIHMGEALKNESIGMTGPKRFKRDLSIWLGTNYFARIGTPS
jgi:hypothetical protein